MFHTKVVWFEGEHKKILLSVIKVTLILLRFTLEVSKSYFTLEV